MNSITILIRRQCQVIHRNCEVPVKFYAISFIQDYTTFEYIEKNIIKFFFFWKKNTGCDCNWALVATFCSLYFESSFTSTVNWFWSGVPVTIPSECVSTWGANTSRLEREAFSQSCCSRSSLPRILSPDSHILFSSLLHDWLTSSVWFGTCSRSVMPSYCCSENISLSI